MQQFRLYKKIALTTLSASLCADPIGDIVEYTGSAGLLREQEQLVVSDTNIPGVELYDTATTANGRMLIQFLDKAKLSLTEHTKVLIDEVIYDPDPSKSKMAMKMVFGTARFASGLTGAVNKKNIKIETPTAQIGIRGTDFTTTIDEIGRSLIILLPDQFGNASGEITVTNEAGTVTLNEAYATTMVSTLNSLPTQPVVVNDINPSIIDNMFIVSPPADVRQQIQEEAMKKDEDGGILDVDFLEFSELEQDALKDTEENLGFSELDIDLLSVDFLTDLLDVIEELDKKVRGADPVESSEGIGTIDLKGASIGNNSDSQYNIFTEDNKIIFYREVNGVIRLKIPAASATRIETFVEGYEGIIDLNGGDDSIIVIRQQ
jgi:hypothetical protein